MFPKILFLRLYEKKFCSSMITTVTSPLPHRYLTIISPLRFIVTVTDGYNYHYRYRYIKLTIAVSLIYPLPLTYINRYLNLTDTFLTYSLTKIK